MPPLHTGDHHGEKAISSSASAHSLAISCQGPDC